MDEGDAKKVTKRKAVKKAATPGRSSKRLAAARGDEEPPKRTRKRSPEAKAPLQKEEEAKEKIEPEPEPEPKEAGGGAKVADGSAGSSNDDRWLCVVCLEIDRRVVLKPCRHFVCCAECAKKVNEKQGVCPLCQAKIEHVESVFV